MSQAAKKSAGICAKCGFEKIWNLKVLNQKTGKENPAHIDPKGNRLGTLYDTAGNIISVGSGDCGAFQNPRITMDNWKQLLADANATVHDVVNINGQPIEHPLKTPAPLEIKIAPKQQPAPVQKPAPPAPQVKMANVASPANFQAYLVAFLNRIVANIEEFKEKLTG